MPATMSGPSLRALGDLIRNGQVAAQAEAPPMPPEMPIDEVEAALNGIKPSGRKGQFIRSRGPTIDRLTGAAVEQDLPPTYGSSYKDKMRSLMADGNVAGDSNTSPVRVDSNVEFKKPGDPRGSDTGTIVFNQDVPGRGGSIFDNQRGRDYLTAATLRQEAMDRGETNLPPLPGLRGQGLGTTAGQPIPGGKTDQYNQMKAAQRANQLANEANAPNLIMAREQLRNYGPRGAVMMKMLAQGGNGQGGGMDPALLAGLDPNMADAALRHQDITGLNKRREGETAIGMRNAGTNEFAAQANAEYQKKVADTQELAARGKITNDEALARIAQAEVDAKVKISADTNQTSRDNTAAWNNTQLAINAGNQDLQKQLGMARIEVDRLVANNALTLGAANHIMQLKKLQQDAILAKDRNALELATAQLQDATRRLGIQSQEKLGVLGNEADRHKTDTNAKANLLNGDPFMPTEQKLSYLDGQLPSATPFSPTEMAKNMPADAERQAAIISRLTPQQLIELRNEMDPTHHGVMRKIFTGNQYPETRSLLASTLGAGGLEDTGKTQIRQSAVKLINKLIATGSL